MDGKTIYRNRWKVLGVLIAFMISVFLLVLMMTGHDEEDEVYVNESAHVIQQGSGETSINISDFSGEEARTQKKASGSYVYEEGRFMTEFSYLGIYKGEVFSKTYSRNGETVMYMSDDFDPNDGVINSYITAKIVEENETEKVETNIYLDEDFKEFADSELYLAWGENWENYRPFEFKEVAPNMYMDTVTYNDTSRFVHGAQVSDANFAVGTFTEEEVKNKDTDIEAAVFMK